VVGDADVVRGGSVGSGPLAATVRPGDLGQAWQAASADWNCSLVAVSPTSLTRLPRSA
jgi:hypothetical protein